MLITKDLVQNKDWTEPKEYEKIYFEYASTDKTEEKPKTQATKDGRREDVKLNGAVWKGTKPVEVKFKDRKFASNEERDAFLTNLESECVQKIAELYPDEEPVMLMLSAVTDGVSQWQRNALVGKNRLGKQLDETEARDAMFKNLMATRKYSEKQARARVEMAFAPIEEEEAVSA